MSGGQPSEKASQRRLLSISRSDEAADDDDALAAEAVVVGDAPPVGRRGGRGPWEQLDVRGPADPLCPAHRGGGDGSTLSSSSAASRASAYDEDEESKCDCKRFRDMAAAGVEDAGTSVSSSEAGLCKHSLVVFYPSFGRGEDAEAPGLHVYGRRYLSPRRGRCSPLTAREKCFGLVAGAAVVSCFAIAMLLVHSYRHSSSYERSSEATGTTICLTDACVETAGTLIRNMDRTVNPCENFFQYSCGSFNKRHVITEDKTSINSIDILIEELHVTIKELLEETPLPGEWSSVTKAKALYASCLNRDLIEYAGDLPLRRLIEELGGWPMMDERVLSPSATTERRSETETKSRETIIAEVSSQLNMAVLLSVGVEVDDQNSSIHVIQIRQPAHLSMMSRDYYIDPKHHLIMTAYRDYMTEISELLLNSSSAVRDALSDIDDIIHFEKGLAQIMIPEAERMEKNVQHVKVTVDELAHSYPGFDWPIYLSKAVQAEVNLNEKVSIYDVKYIKNLLKLLRRTSDRTVYNYMIWRVIIAFAEELTFKYELADFKFKKVLYGFQSPEPRWRKCLKYVRRQMDMVVAAMLAQSKFGKDSLQTANELISNLRDSFREMLADATWMDEETRRHALVKANAMSEKIGYPEYVFNSHFVDGFHDELVVTKENYFQNLLNLEKFHSSKRAKVLREPVDPTLWRQPITEVNAFYDPNGNEMVFPAGIWQAPFFSSKYPRSMIYGGIGVVIGHEITHGFDSKGRLHDKNGNVREWWTNETNEAFTERSQCMADQYSNVVIDQVAMNVDGKITLSENIADNGGVKEAFLAYQKWVNKHGAEERLPGLELTGEQLFFVNYAQIWCGNIRDEQLIMDIKVSEHSPNLIRTHLPLANLDAFAKAFSCPLGSPMNPINKCVVW